MFIQHLEKGFHYTDRELLLVARKLGKLATYCKRVTDEGSAIRVEAERRETKKSRDQLKVIITIKLPKKSLRAESRRTDVIAALDRCIEKLEPQVKRYKEQHSDSGRARQVRKARKK